MASTKAERIEARKSALDLLKDCLQHDNNHKACKELKSQLEEVAEKEIDLSEVDQLAGTDGALDADELDAL